jgi:hypothetical protein
MGVLLGGFWGGGLLGGVRCPFGGCPFGVLLGSWDPFWGLSALDRRRAAGARAEAGQTRLGCVLWLLLLGPLLYLVLRRGMPDH